MSLAPVTIYNYSYHRSLIKTRQENEPRSTSKHDQVFNESVRRRPPNTRKTRENRHSTFDLKSHETVQTSKTIGTVDEFLRRERRAHTMAPLTRITGPSSTAKATMFATLKAPTESGRIQTTSFPEMTDDDAPIIVKVRYDATLGVLPSQDIVQRAIDQKLQQQTNTRMKQKDPIVLNFFQNQTERVPPQPVVHRSKSIGQTLLHRPVPTQPPKPLINQEVSSYLRRSNQNLSSAWPSTGLNTFKSIHSNMATQRHAPINTQQTLAGRPQTAPSSAEMFRPPAVTDIPELSKENLLNMLNQIPDLQGRQFNIEYASTGAPEAYPIPLNLEGAGNSYPEPVVIDQLPNNVIQHVKKSNNPALAAALDAAIQDEQPRSTFNVQSNTVVRHAAQQHQQVQESRPVSSDESSTEDSSSSDDDDDETSSSTS